LTLKKNPRNCSFTRLTISVCNASFEQLKNKYVLSSQQKLVMFVKINDKVNFQLILLKKNIDSILNKDFVHLLINIEAKNRIDSDNGCWEHLQLFTLYALLPSTGIPS